MRRDLTIFSLILIILIVFSQVALPPIAVRTMESRLASVSQAKSVQVHLQTTPAILILLGQLDQLDITAEQAMLGQVRVDSLRLSGRSSRRATNVPRPCVISMTARLSSSS